MIETGLLDLQIAIFQRLSQDPELMSRVTGVYDRVPEDTEYPYVTIGEPDVTPEETKTSFRENIPWTMHAFTFNNGEGKAPAYKILNSMLMSLTRTRLAVPGYTLHQVKMESYRVFEDIDGETHHAILRVRFILQKTGV